MSKPSASRTPDGGSAFPEVFSEFSERSNTLKDVYSAGGMTLRQYFATKFAAAWVIALSSRHGLPGYLDTDVVYEANRLGLQQADAMLEQEKV